MAVAYQSYNFTARATATSVTITKPSGLAVGDLMIAQIQTNASSGAITVPSGWTLIDSTTSWRINMYYKVAVSDDVSAADFTWTTANSAVISGGIVRITGQNPVQPIFSYSKTVTPADPLNIPSIDTVADSMLLMGVINDTNASFSAQAIATSNPTWTELWDTDPAQSGSHAFAYSSIRSAGTATGTGTCTTTSAAKAPSGILICIPPDKSILQSETITLVETSIQNITLRIITETIAMVDTLVTSVKKWYNQVKNTSTWLNDDKN